MTSTLYTEYIIHCVKETRQVIGNTMVKLRLDHNNLDKAMANNNPSVIECQHIAWCPVWWCQCICTHSVAWRVLLCPVWSMLGGEDRGHSRGRPVALPGLTTPGHGEIYHPYFLSFKIKSARRKRSSDQDHVVSHHILSGVSVVCWRCLCPHRAP